jgi:hypothetical protein
MYLQDIWRAHKLRGIWALTRGENEIGERDSCHMKDKSSFMKRKRQVRIGRDSQPHHQEVS